MVLLYNPDCLGKLIDAIRSQFSEQVLALPSWRSVEIIYVLVIQARLDLIQSAIKSVHAINEVLHIGCQLFVLLSVCMKPLNYLTLVPSFKVVPIFDFVEIGKELVALGGVA